MMIRALKMTADRIADSGRVQPHDVQRVQAGEHAGEHGRDDREVLRDVVGDRERGQRAAGDQQLLADLDDLDELGRVGVEVDHVAGLLRGRRAGVHRDADVGLGEGRGVVGAVAGHRDQPAALLLALDQRHLVLGRGLGEEVVDAGLLGDGPGGQRVVAGDHHGADAHPAHLVEPLAHALLDDVLEVDHARASRAAPPLTHSATTSGVPPAVEIAVDDAADLLGRVPAVVADPLHHRGGGALADLPAVVEVDPAHPGLRGERDEVRGRAAPPGRAPAARARSWPARRSSGPRGSRRPGWTAGRRRRARRRSTPLDREELGGLPVAERDGAGLVQQQRVHVAGGLDRATGHGQHVVLHQPVHAGDADGRQQRADRGRDQADQQRDQHDQRLLGAGVDRERLQGDGGHQEHDGQAGQQDVQRDLVRASSAATRPRPGRSSGR